jgi:hypothetical protein
VPFGRNRSSGSLARFPTIVICVSPAISTHSLSVMA